MILDLEQHKIGIYIPTYNKGKYIRQTIESLLNQTHENFTITVIDNASTDDTETVIKSIKDNRVRYTKNETNIGSIRNINRCVELATEDIMCIYHSDDVYENTILEKELKFLLNNPKINIVFTDKFVIDENDNITFSNQNNFLSSHTLVNYKELLSENLKYGTPLVCPTFMCRRKVFDEVGKFSVDYEFAGDTEFYLRAAKTNNIGIIGEQLIRYRVYLGQETSRYLKMPKLQEEYILLNRELEYFHGFLKDNIDEDTMEIYKKRLAQEHLRVAKYMVLLNKNTANLEELIDHINKSIEIIKYPIYSGSGLKQRLLKLKFFGLFKFLFKFK